MTSPSITRSTQPIYPAWLRATHTINAIATIILAMSGWRIYNASPFFDFKIPEAITMGGWLAGALQWHFAAMWLLGANGILYLLLNVGTGRFFSKFFPLSPRIIITDLLAALRGHLSHADLRHYNGVQRMAYLFVIVDAIVLILSGLVLWKTVQFPLLRELMGDYEIARRVHFIAMAAMTAFVVVHLIMVALVPRTLLAMLRGR